MNKETKNVLAVIAAIVIVLMLIFDLRVEHSTAASYERNYEQGRRGDQAQVPVRPELRATRQAEHDAQVGSRRLHQLVPRSPRPTRRPTLPPLRARTLAKKAKQPLQILLTRLARYEGASLTSRPRRRVDRQARRGTFFMTLIKQWADGTKPMTIKAKRCAGWTRWPRQG
jgi:hypothetical protein